MEDYYILVQNDIKEANLLEERMFKDILEDKTRLSVVKENSKDFVCEFLARRKIQKLSNGKINFVFIKRYELFKLLDNLHNKYKQIYVIFLNTTFTTVRYPSKVLQQIKQKWINVKYILFYIDPCSRSVSSYANYLFDQNIFDLVYTFDAHDAKKRNLILWTTPYSKLYKDNIIVDKDLYFAGVETDREKIINMIIKKSKENNINLSMDIVCNLENTMITKNSKINLHSKQDILSYDEILNKTLQAKCILDIVRPNQTGLTLRAYEAVVYNRKLLTNNKSILSFPFYNMKYIQYFDDLNNIDWEWVKKDIEIEYNYSDEFSPKKLLEDIQRKLNSNN